MNEASRLPLVASTQDRKANVLLSKAGMAEVQTYLTEEGSNLISLSGPLLKP